MYFLKTYFYYCHNNLIDHDNLFMVNATYSVLNNNQLSQLLPGLHDISYPPHGFICSLVQLLHRHKNPFLAAHSLLLQIYRG